jgi:putative effector of murein hydrolase LrgA (UPF0299 family)
VLGLLFVPAGVGLAQYAGAGPLWLAVLGIVLVGALATLAVTGHVTQLRLGQTGRSGGLRFGETGRSGR